MRWVKHKTMAHADAEVDAVLEEFGPVAYGVYWLIIEEIASAMEPGKDAPEAVRSIQKWASICQVPPRVFRKIIARLAVHLVTACETSDGRLKIAVPNILKYRDEYSRKSGHAPDQTKTEGRTDAREDLTEKRLEADAEISKRIPAKASQSEKPLQRIAVDGADPHLSACFTDDGLRAPSALPAVAPEQSKLAADIDRMRVQLDAINRDRLRGTLPPADAGTAKNVLEGVRRNHPGIDPDAAADLLVKRMFGRGQQVRPDSWGLVVTVARKL